MSSTLIALGVIFTQLSLLAFGGGNTILPEMHRQVVDIHHWMSARDFTALYAVAQAAPGPNMMVVTLVGWHVAGWPGVIVTTLAKFGPSSLVTIVAMRLWQRFKDAPWRATVQSGLVPMTVGLVAASAALISEAADHLPVLFAITAAVAVLTFTTRIHPLWPLAGGALIGWLGFGQI
jgi:chromate transporter